MKLFLTEPQKKLVLEILRSSQNNAVKANDAELVFSFEHLIKKVVPDNVLYVELKRPEVEAIMEFCRYTVDGLNKAYAFLEKDTSRDADEVNDLKERITKNKEDIVSILEQIQSKIQLVK